MLNSNQLDNLAFEEQLKVEKAQQIDEGREYSQFLQQAARNRHGQLSDQVLTILHSTQPNEDPLDDTRENIEAIIDYVVGDKERWCSDGTETREFRKLVAEAFEEEWAAFLRDQPPAGGGGTGVTIGEAMMKLPARFLVNPLQQTQLEALSKTHPSARNPSVGAFRCLVHYVDQDNLDCSTYREFLFSDTADQAIAVTVDRIKSVLRVDHANPREFMFRLMNRAEYVYGEEPLLNFRCIRDAIVKGTEIHLQILPLPFHSSVLTAPRFSPQYSVATGGHASLTHDDLEHQLHTSILEGSPDLCPALSIWSCDSKLTFDVTEVNNVQLLTERCKQEKLREGDDIYICVVAEVVYGTQILCAPERTPWRCCRSLVGSNGAFSSRVLWGDDCRIEFPSLSLSNLPREAKICLTLAGVGGDSVAYIKNMTATQLLDDTIREKKQLKRFISLLVPVAGSDEEQQVPLFYLATASVQLFDHRGFLRGGSLSVRLWNGDQRANPIGTNSLNPDASAVGCRLVFPRFALPLLHPSGAPPEHKLHEMQVAHHDKLLKLDIQLRNNKIAQLRLIKRVLSQDPLYTITPTERILLWQYRNDLIKRPKALAKLLQAVDWTQPAAVHEAHLLLGRWASLEPLDALELLDARFADGQVRQYAINCIDRMGDSDLQGCLLQLVQVLKYEPFHYSALARFLLKRAIRSPHCIGHTVFWHLRSEMSNTRVCERHGLLIEEFLKRLPSRRDFLREYYVVDQLLNAAMRVKECTKKGDRAKVLNVELRKIKFPARFTLALNPTMECSGLIFRECKVMDSKKLPLWLSFTNVYDPTSPIYIIFKAGDDLRQDLLTLQMLSLMDNLWKASGLDLHMIPYGCVATGEGIGMIEIVLSSDTIANITRKDGGAQAAFSEEPLMNWLRKYNRTPADVEKCVWNFAYSTAGYCVATYVLGIGDRHNDNIMCRQDGTLFHIDFGHFLGNYKTKFGIKRETAPFIFTGMYAYMLGGPNHPIYAHFQEVACHAYNIIRRHSNMLIILFLLMLSTGIPELQRIDDITWLKTVLLMDATDEEATAHYRQMIEDALNNKRTLINDYIHIIAH